MTEELIQKAEEYAINMWGNDEAFIDERNNCKQDYIAGATENSIQWHDLRKNPNDLPKHYTEVWCDYGEDYGKGFYHKDDGGWWIEGHIYCSVIDAWCELPTRSKENE